MIEPGLYTDLSNDAYHSEPDYLSSSYLKTLLPDFYSPPPEDDNALDVGTVFHARALGTDEEIVVCDFPTWQSKAAAEARAEAKARGAVPILTRDSERVDGMVKSLRSDPDASELMAQHGARPEVSCFATDADGVRIKARFDLLAPIAVDLKSTSSDLTERELSKAVETYGYALSVAHYLDVAAALDLDVTDLLLVFVHKRAPHPVMVTPLDPAFLDRGRRLLALAKHRAANPTEPRRLTLSPPAWAPTIPAAHDGIPADFTWSLDDIA